ncbi:MAG: EthD family reductase [Candidatus Binatia bacterium]
MSVVVKLVTFCKRRAGLSVEAFQDEWRTTHAETVLRLPSLRGYAQSHVLLSGYRKREPFCDVLDEMWFADRGALEAACASQPFADTGARRLVTIEHLVKEGRQLGAGVKNIELVVRRPDLAVEEFHRYWRVHHGPLAARIAPIRRYVQSHSIDDPATRRYDGIASTWFDDVDAMRASAATEEYRQTREDEDNFVTPPLSFVITREHVLVAPPALKNDD